MTREEAVKAALTALGTRWREDWSEFDGRTLRFQLETVAGLFDAEDYEARAEEFIEDQREANEWMA